MESKIKALFFSQYFGQEIAVQTTTHGTEMLPICVTNITKSLPEMWHLLLRTIDQLTDDELTVIAGIFHLDEDAINCTDLLEWVEALFTESAGYYIDGYTANEVLYTIDYLRSIGIILPFTYLNEQNQPVTLTPDEIISKGWAKTI